jgi:two-component system OmpR family sensor kinase
VVGSARRAMSGIRFRIVVGYVVLLASALSIAVIVTRQVLLSRLDRDIDRALSQEVEELRRLAGGTNPTTGEPFGADVEAIFDIFLRRNVPAPSEAFYTLVDGEPYLYSFDAPAELLDDDELVDTWASTGTPSHRTFQTSAGEARTLTVPLRSADGIEGTFVVAWFPEPDRQEVLQAVRVVMIAAAVVLVITTLVAWSLAGRVLRPVRRLTQTAQRISDSELSERIPVDGQDELAVLGTTFNDMLDRLEHGFIVQRQFLDDVAHELRTPITIARGHLEVLGDDPEEIAETKEVVTDELDHMSRYVDDLLVLAKSEHPDFLRLAPIDTAELAHNVMQRAAGLATRTWVLDAEPAPGRYLAVADAGRLMQAVLNLATNAVQHTDESDEIGIGVDADNDKLRLWVRDTGPGVDPAVADTLFLRHTRGVTSRASRPEGTGLGLSIVDAIARAHGGRVVLDNAVGSGATFAIIIPLEIAESAPTAPPSSPRTPPPWSAPDPSNEQVAAADRPHASSTSMEGT